MKTFLIGLIIIVSIFGCAAIIFVGFFEMSDRDRLKQVEIDGLNKRIKEQADSLEKQLALTRDSLSIAFETIKQANIERQAAHERSQKTIRDLQRIVYIQHTDSSRQKALSQLYKTYR